MRVLMISGDQNLARPGTSAHERFLLQKNAIEALELVLWPQQFWKPFFVSGKFDVVTSQDPFWRGLVAFLAARRLGAKLNIQVHADIDEQSLTKHVLAKIVLRHSSSVRAVSQKIKMQVERSTKAPVTVLPIYIDVSRFATVIHEQHPKFAKTILWVGRFEDEKDPLHALSVLAQVRASGVDAGLVMLGSGSLEAHLHEMAKKQGIEKYIEFPGWQDPAAYLKYADVLLCTSRAESFGASLIEALASGIAVVAPDVGVAREAGALVAPKEQLAQAVAEVFQKNTRGLLLMTILNKEEWVAAWKQSLE